MHLSPVRYQGTSTSQSALSRQTSHLEGHLHLQTGAQSVTQQTLLKLHGWTPELVSVCYEALCVLILYLLITIEK